jgi:serine/threonine-protein kinase
MAKDPDQRFRSMDEVLAALKRVGGATLTQTISGVGTGEYRSLAGSGSGPQVTQHSLSGSGANPAFLSPGSGSDPGSIPSPLSMPSDSPGSLSIGAPLMSQPPGKSGSKGMLVAAVVGALAIAGIIGYVALRPAKPVAVGTAPLATGATGPTSAVTGPEAPTAVAPTGTIAVPSATLVKVRINTDPDGASVKEDGVELCSSTPCDILYKGSDADPTKEHKLTLVRNGYRLETKSVKVGDSPINVKLSAAPVIQYRPQPVVQQKQDAPPVPTGYKTDIPY